MTIPILVAGIALMASGLWVLVAPGPIRGLMTWFMKTGRYGIAVLVRLAIGLALVFGAQATRMPAAAITLGVIFLCAATAIPFLGEERMGAMLSWWLHKPPILLRAWGAVVVLFGSFITWLAL